MMLRLENIAAGGLGLDMYEAHLWNDPMPQINVDVLQCSELKELIRAMTSYLPSSRPSSADVNTKLLAFFSEVRALAIITLLALLLHKHQSPQCCNISNFYDEHYVVNTSIRR